MKILRYGVMALFCVALIIFTSSVVVDFLKSDSSVPELTSDRDVVEIPCDYTKEQILAGLSAKDEQDGDLTSQIIAGNQSRFIEKGVCNVTYVVFDSAGQSASLTRKVRFTDYYSPRFYASDSLTFLEKEGTSTELLKLLSVEDALDGDLTSMIVFDNSNVNYSLAGSYTGTFSVTNSYGDTRNISLPVHIIDSSKTIDIQLSQGIVYLATGQTIDPDQYVLKAVNSEGDSVSTRNIATQSTVNSQVPGTYEIQYTISSGGEQGEAWLTVVVE